MDPGSIAAQSHAGSVGRGTRGGRGGRGRRGRGRGGNPGRGRGGSNMVAAHFEPVVDAEGDRLLKRGGGRARGRVRGMAGPATISVISPQAGRQRSSFLMCYISSPVR